MAWQQGRIMYKWIAVESELRDWIGIVGKNLGWSATVCQLLAEPTQILSYNSLSFCNSHVHDPDQNLLLIIALINYDQYWS